MNVQQKIVVVILDVVVLIELCVAMYLGSRQPESLTPVFIKSFLSMLVPTLILAKVMVRALRTRSAESRASA